MLTILLEAVQYVVPQIGSLVAKVEIQSAFFSAVVFAYLLGQLWFGSRPTA